jgi:hypothetical protein
VFGRRTSQDSTASTGGATRAGSAPAATGKGRPTPTRAQAQAARKQRTAPPRNRKEAAARRKVTMRESRGKVRAAMDTGDDRYLPARDQGPVKRYIRDYVDSHHTIGQFLLPIFFVIFVLVYFSTTWSPLLGNFAWLVVMVLLALDSLRIMRGVKAGIRAKFGADATSGITMYTLMRSWQMRRLRLPKPQVKPGDPL